MGMIIYYIAFVTYVEHPAPHEDVPWAGLLLITQIVIVTVIEGIATAVSAIWPVVCGLRSGARRVDRGN